MYVFLFSLLFKQGKISEAQVNVQKYVKGLEFQISEPPELGNLKMCVWFVVFS